MTIRIFKEWLVKYFFVHKIVFKAIKPGLGQAQKYDRVKPVNGFPTFPF
jgi:hypothetical protein